MLQKATSFAAGLFVTLALSAAVVSTAGAQWRVVDDDEWCRDRDYGDRDRGWYCEVRELTLAADRDPIAVDADPNGGIRVEGWDRNEILVRAKVSGQSWTDEEARDLVSGVEVLTGGRMIEARGPRGGRREHWAVSYEIFAPMRSNLSLETTNGGITIEDVAGDIEFYTTNGGVRLLGVGGDVRGHTSNGGLHVELTGTEWQGDGMDVRTTNGGVRIEVPEDYSARLETGTTNGGLRFDFPVTVQGRLNRRLSVDLGSGGRLIRATTTNGGVVVRRR
ncbi:MAG: DUF4097 family beta strand repeat protein [Gemmatimonadales bacterium]|nr:DUF4097 family beta strand repeat protein [Gemmatimonadales bacterium]NIN13399.1 DUF4097 family beta strand repeat protein [Gemmatimonadales bacterium]NIN51402.1 DUF4097 family beta strand repeat protein [Gemmatimonadales bacterium]NIP08866.1 DUF4097 family beta strand repeat protein [Gemmatimonadales bacterium]NIQ99860.1 DUF4097 family beta strand repeat protein [Gemmatimonadales bacterium]